MLTLAVPCLRAEKEGVRVLPAITATPEAQGDGIVPDPQVTWGRLPNGLRYAIRRQKMPPGRVSLCLHVIVGSRYEGEDEPGYAHFVEHMAFAGTRDFPGDGAIRTLQRYGLGFGSGVNGATGRSFTRYEIRNLPSDDPEALATALRVLRNFADAVSFEPEAVERERGVILSEKSVRAGRIGYWWRRELEYLEPVSHEISDNELAAVFSEAPMARLPLGTVRAIRRATPERLKAFYRRWYRPERMVLAVVGDADAPSIAAQLVAAFAGMQPGSGPMPAEIPVASPRASEKTTPVVFTEAEAGSEIVSLASAVPRLAGDTPRRRRRELAETVAMLLLERRLGRALKVPAVIDAYCNHEVPGWTVPLLRLRVAPEDWTAAAKTMDTEVRRAIQHGFGAEELEAAVDICRRQQLVAERDAPNRLSTEVSVALAHAMSDGLVFASPESERAWLERVSGQVTLQECRDAVARLWPEAYTRLVITGPVESDAGGVRATQRALTAIRKSALAPIVPVATPEVLLPTEFGTPGTVAQQEYDAAKDCWLVQFDNGVRLNFKATPFEQGRVRVRVGFGYGLLGTESGREGLVFGIAALCYGNVANLDSEQEGDLLAREGISSSFGFGADRFGLSANCPATGFATAMRLFAARLAMPGSANGGVARARAFIEEQSTRYDRTSAGVAEDRLREYIFGGHHALTRPRRLDTMKLTYADLRHWIEPQLLRSPLEITVVGDIGLNDAIVEVARTLGALPLRSTVDQLADRRLFTPGKTPQRIETRFQGKRAVASVALAWQLYDVVGLEDDCRLRLLAGVLEDRIRVRLRQEMGKTYTPSVGLMTERALSPALLFLRCRIETEPRQVERVSEATKMVVDDIVRNGISADELERARVPLVRQAEENVTSNSWWLFALDEAQTKPQFVEGQGRQKEIYRAITRAELNDLARLLFSPERLCEVVALPE